MSAPTKFVSRGRFKSGCMCGRNGRVPEVRTSVLETTVFNVLNFVLGCGQQDVFVPFDRRMNLDMLFAAGTGFRLGVEYDGAYWHRGRKRTDRRKLDLLVDSGFVHEVIRIREQPLKRVGHLDLLVPRGVPGQEVAARTLLHLSHTVATAFGADALERIDFHALRPGRACDIGKIRCPGCRKTSQRFY